jgi:hypothetical protein
MMCILGLQRIGQGLRCIRGRRFLCPYKSGEDEILNPLDGIAQFPKTFFYRLGVGMVRYHPFLDFFEDFGRGL